MLVSSVELSICTRQDAPSRLLGSPEHGGGCVVVVGNGAVTVVVVDATPVDDVVVLATVVEVASGEVVVVTAVEVVDVVGGALEVVVLDVVDVVLDVVAVVDAVVVVVVGTVVVVVVTGIEVVVVVIGRVVVVVAGAVDVVVLVAGTVVVVVVAQAASQQGRLGSATSIAFGVIEAALQDLDDAGIVSIVELVGPARDDRPADDQRAARLDDGARRRRDGAWPERGDRRTGVELHAAALDRDLAAEGVGSIVAVHAEDSATCELGQTVRGDVHGAAELRAARVDDAGDGDVVAVELRVTAAGGAGRLQRDLARDRHVPVGRGRERAAVAVGLDPADVDQRRDEDVPGVRFEIHVGAVAGAVVLDRPAACR